MIIFVRHVSYIFYLHRHVVSCVVSSMFIGHSIPEFSFVISIFKKEEEG